MENKKLNQLTLLIGHRGVGKTSLLRRLKCYYKKLNQEARFYDLDQFIVEQAGKSINEIFEQEGELFFREYEQKYLQDLVAAPISLKTFIVLGAGFKGPYPKHCEIVFIKRASDQAGRVFLDRPRLDKQLSAFDEYKKLYQKREEHYLSLCTQTLFLQEGTKAQNQTYEKVFFGLEKIKNFGGCFTLQKNDWLKGGNKFIRKRLDWGVDFIEIRSDHWTQKEINEISACIPVDKILWSKRESKKTINVNAITDWALELGEPSNFSEIISLHELKKTFSQTFTYIDQYKKKAKHLKLALPVSNFEELAAGHSWYLQDPLNRSFLPISEDGRWAWYRLWHKDKMFPNFFKETETGSACDQPFFHQWSYFAFDQPKSFAAILGSPLSHSWTPNEQQNFFLNHNMPVLTIKMNESECSKDNLNFLKKLGLKAAAVTSPLKNKIKDLVVNNKFESVNTISFCETKNVWQSTNTDEDGLSVLLGQYKNEPNIVLWGGGGVFPSVCKELPKVHAYSARRVQARTGFDKVKNPQVLIWAVGRSRHQNWPQASWSPKTVIDLNYSEDSPGREYALKVGAKYISGEKMFYEQAKKQREFWQKFL